MAYNGHTFKVSEDCRTCTVTNRYGEEVYVAVSVNSKPARRRARVAKKARNWVRSNRAVRKNIHDYFGV